MMAPSAVSSALEVEEILGAIFRHLSPYAWDRQAILVAPHQLNATIGKDFSHIGVENSPCATNQRALVQSSRVSRAFSGQALKVLWRTLPDLQPLQRLLDAMDFSYADCYSGMPIHVSN